MLIIPLSVYEDFIAAARAALPREAAGLVWGRDRRVERFQLMRNLAEAPGSFRMDEAEVTSALADSGILPLAIFHSHPTDLPVPSASDLTGALDWREVIHLILSLADGPRLRCWRLFDGQALPEPFHIPDVERRLP